MARRTGARTLVSLKLLDYSDREFLHIVEESADGSGWADARAVADAIGLRGDNATRSVGSRCAWLRRYGVLEKDTNWPSKSRWRLTPKGGLIMNGRLRAPQLRALGELTEEQLLLATHELTQIFAAAGPEAARLASREWRYGTQREW